jgi:hypothetical protein
MKPNPGSHAEDVPTDVCYEPLLNGEVTMNQQAIRWEFYQQARNPWRWRKYQDGAVVADSPDGYSSFQECVKHAELTGYVAPDHRKPRVKVLP